MSIVGVAEVVQGLEIAKRLTESQQELPSSGDDSPQAPSSPRPVRTTIPKGPYVWVQYIDDNTNAAYYYNMETGETSWERPKERFVHHDSTEEYMSRLQSQAQSRLQSRYQSRRDLLGNIAEKDGTDGTSPKHIQGHLHESFINLPKVEEHGERSQGAAEPQVPVSSTESNFGSRVGARRLSQVVNAVTRGGVVGDEYEKNAWLRAILERIDGRLARVEHMALSNGQLLKNPPRPAKPWSGLVARMQQMERKIESVQTLVSKSNDAEQKIEEREKMRARVLSKLQQDLLGLESMEVKILNQQEEAQFRSKEQFVRVEKSFRECAEAQKWTAEKLQKMDERFQTDLKVAKEEALAHLSTEAARNTKLQGRIGRLAEGFERLSGDVGDMQIFRTHVKGLIDELRAGLAKLEACTAALKKSSSASNRAVPNPHEVTVARPKSDLILLTRLTEDASTMKAQLNSLQAIVQDLAKKTPPPPAQAQDTLAASSWRPPPPAANRLSSPAHRYLPASHIPSRAMPPHVRSYLGASRSQGSTLREMVDQAHSKTGLSREVMRSMTKQPLLNGGAGAGGSGARHAPGLDSARSSVDSLIESAHTLL